LVPADANGPYVPTENNVVGGTLKLAGVRNTDVVYDLGCGDGRIGCLVQMSPDSKLGSLTPPNGSVHLRFGPAIIASGATPQ
jgi:hypothetical protein